MLDREEIARWGRLTAAMLEHAANDDTEAFAQVVELLETAARELPTVAAMLRLPKPLPDGSLAPGYSWAEIAAPLGVTRQAAAKRFGKVG